MAVYKIFPEKSATLYSYYPTLNTGIDEILEISTYLISGTYQVSRPIIQFSQNEISDILDNKVGNAKYDAYLRLSLAYAAQLPINYDLYCYPLYNQWQIGTGRFNNTPITTDGASWEYTDGTESGTVWYYTNNIPDPNLQYHDDGTNHGGGLWWGNYFTSQEFTNITSKDILMDVGSIVDAWYYGDINNNGFILKYDDSLEFESTSANINLKYFSSNTHTIYPPCLEIRWEDVSYNPGTLSSAIADSVVTLGNNKSEYQQDSVQRFRINVRDRFPARAFQSTSIYLTNKALPETSYYSIKDLDTEEIVVDYDITYTKISCDSTGNYFDVYMNGLEPERYYQILIKTIIDGETIVFDDNYYFKVIR